MFCGEITVYQGIMIDELFLTGGEIESSRY